MFRRNVQLMCCSVPTFTEEYVVYQVGLIPSKFYKVLGDKDWHAFLAASLQAFGIIVSISLVSFLWYLTIVPKH